jgi:signal transduction histidine kinase
LATATGISQELAEEVSRVSGAASVAVYLAGPDDATYRLTATAGDGRFVSTIGGTAVLPTWLCLNASPGPLPADILPLVAVSDLPTALVLSLRWGNTMAGFVILGAPTAAWRPRSKALRVLALLAEDAAVAIVATTHGPVPAGTVLTSAAIHDIKNSVSALSMLARNVAANFANPDFRRDALVTISSTVERMRRSLERLSSSGGEETSIGREQVDLGELIVEATMPLASDSRIQLVRRLESVVVHGERETLRRVIENLLTNAVEAIAYQGIVTVTLTADPDYATLSVADTGCGIPETYRERDLFSPFRSTKPGGWGVGLYQTKRVVERHGGEILVDSVDGRGTIFTVRLPLPATLEATSLRAETIP